MRYALTHLLDDDIIYIGDADEIWNPDNMPPIGRWKLEQKVYAYYLNNRSSEWWEGTSVMQYKDVKEDTLDNLRAHDIHRKHMKAPTFGNGGWHFTNCQSYDNIIRKIKSYSHQEINTSQVKGNLRWAIDNNKDFIGRDFQMWIDESQWPEYLKNNRNAYKHLLK